MNKHHSISAASFSPKTLRALAKKGLYLVGSTFVPAPGGDFTNGESAYIISDGRLLRWLDVYNLAGA